MKNEAKQPIELTHPSLKQGFRNPNVLVGILPTDTFGKEMNKLGMEIGDEYGTSYIDMKPILEVGVSSRGGFLGETVGQFIKAYRNHNPSVILGFCGNGVSTFLNFAGRNPNDLSSVHAVAYNAVTTAKICSYAEELQRLYPSEVFQNQIEKYEDGISAINEQKKQGNIRGEDRKSANALLESYGRHIKENKQLLTDARLREYITNRMEILYNLYKRVGNPSIFDFLSIIGGAFFQSVEFSSYIAPYACLFPNKLNLLNEEYIEDIQWDALDFSNPAQGVLRSYSSYYAKDCGLIPETLANQADSRIRGLLPAYESPALTFTNTKQYCNPSFLAGLVEKRVKGVLRVK